MAKILVAEDNAGMCLFIESILINDDHTVATAANKVDVLSQLVLFSPDLVLQDIMLGDDDGRELCQYIKKEHPHIKVILMSSDPRLLHNHDAFLADGKMEKPTGLSNMLEIIESQLS